MGIFKRNPKADVLASTSRTGAVVKTRSTDAFTERPVEERTFGELTGGVGQIRMGAFARQFGRNLRWALPLFLLGTAGAFYMTKDFQRSYTGEGRVLAQISSEYVYDPVPGQSSPGLMLTPDHIVLNEVAIMTSPAVTTRVMEQLFATYGIDRVEPSAASTRQVGVSPSENADILRSFERRLGASPQAKSSVIDMSFKHTEPEIAVAGLNAYLAAYMAERQELFVSETADKLSQRRSATEDQLAANEAELAAFLRRNNISDFNSEREGVTGRTEGLKAQLNDLRGAIAETETSLREVEQQLRATPATIDLYVDDRASQRVAQAELELKQLLAKYLPGSDPVRQKQTEIAELKSLVAGLGGRAAGGRRVGPNPVQQELATQRNQIARAADALREKEAVLQAQLNSSDARTRKLRDLSPRFENLARERETLQARLRNLNTREQEAIINQELSQADSENVRVISRAETARKGRNMRAIAFVAATALWAGICFLLALMITFFGDIYARPARAGALSGRRSDDYAPVNTPAAPVIPEPVQPYIPAAAQRDAPAPPPFPDYAADTYAAQPFVDDSALPAYADGSTAAAQPWTAPVTASSGQSVSNPYADAAPTMRDTSNPYATSTVAAPVMGSADSFVAAYPPGYSPDPATL